MFEGIVKMALTGKPNGMGDRGQTQLPDQQEVLGVLNPTLNVVAVE